MMSELLNRQVANALWRMILEYGGNPEHDAVNPNMKESAEEAIEALQRVGYVDANRHWIDKNTHGGG